MKPFIVAALASAAFAASPRYISPRYVMYFDQYHTSSLPNRTVTAGINYVITAFANSSLFTTEPNGQYEPFMPLDQIRSMFDDGTKVCMAIGGWGDTDGFSKGAANCTTQELYAKSIAATLDRLGYDCVDIDWEYPGGNGADYIQNPNSEKVSEIETYAELLGKIKAAIGGKELSIAVPGLEKDMIAFTPEQVPKINAVVDFVNVMTYDFMTRRDNVTNHHTSINLSLHTIETYAARGMSPSKMNLGFAFYAKWFTTAEGSNCSGPIGCPTALLEAADGSDTGKSGALTFEAINFAPVPANLTDSPDMTCGAGTSYRCPNSLCCSQYGSCGSEVAYCGTGCQSEYGVCEGPSTTLMFKTALENQKLDANAGGEWYWDSTNEIFWTWDTPELIDRKFNEIVIPWGLGGVMAWSLAEDSLDWSHINAIHNGVESLTMHIV